LRALRDGRRGDLECPDVEKCTIAISDVLKEACDKHMRKKLDSRHRPLPWWNKMLARELRTLDRWKARLRNANNALIRRALCAKFKRLKAAHKKHCFRARRRAWRDFVTETGNSEPWGPVFKWIKTGGSRTSENLPTAVRKADGTFTTSLRETGERLMETLVPSDSYENESPEQIAARTESRVEVGSFSKWSEDPGHIEPCDVEEVKRAIWRMAPKKSPGMDGITARILRQSWPVLAEFITHAFNNCPQARKFPSTWKAARLVVIRKSADKDPSEAKSYRPIRLLV